MAIGIVTEEDMMKELERLGGVQKEIVPEIIEKVIDINRGRGPKKETPEIIRKFIAEEAILGTPAKDIIEQFGVSQSSISAYKVGATSTASIDRPDPSLKKHIETTKEFIGSAARNRILAAIDALDNDKIGKAKARDIASIAKEMSIVAKNMEPTGPMVQNNQQVIVYKPRMKEEDDYQTIMVNE